ncbi:MAG TPA: hypothetical protein VFC44_07225 [Candidatus Saccharimonadales bacterium]|nr:hypothetical protein [Candidatus Saccharimonadales bacterium]
MNKVTVSLLAVVSVVVTAIIARIHGAFNTQVPVGYEDESGFHFGTPSFEQ